MNITKILLCVLFFILPFIHGKIFFQFGIPLYFPVDGNYEFTKSIFFHIFSSLIYIVFIGESLLNSFFCKSKEHTKYFSQIFSIQAIGGKSNTPHFQVGKIISIFLIILSISTYFSLSPFISLIGDTEKGHTTLLFVHLVGIFLILRSLEKEFLQRLIYITIFSCCIVSVIAIKELFFPVFDYGELSSRALGTLGHPNYLAGYILIILPLVFHAKLPSLIKGGLGTVLIGTIILTQSIVAVFLTFCYFAYFFMAHIFRRGSLRKFGKIKKSGVRDWSQALKISNSRPVSKNKSAFSRDFLKRWWTQIGIYILIILTLCLCLLLIQYFPEKLHSFLSRFSIWETTLRIIFSDIHILFFGAGLETLPYFFESFKSPEMYIYENFGYTADRPHNFLLNILYHLGILGGVFFGYLFYLFCKNYKNTPENHAMILFLLFGIFHFFSVVSYIVFILILSYSLLSLKTLPLNLHSSKEKRDVNHILGICVFTIITVLSFFGSYSSFLLYRAEILYEQQKYHLAQKTFSHPKYLIEIGKYQQAEQREGILSQYNLKNQLITKEDKVSLCKYLTRAYPAAENYLYCGNILERIGEKNLSLEYYRLGLLELPDLWNQDSRYWKNYFIRETISGNRFFSEKFGDIGGVVEKVYNHKNY